MTGRALNRYNAWTAIRKRAKAAGFLTPVGDPVEDEQGPLEATDLAQSPGQGVLGGDNTKGEVFR